jgi:predicted nucleotidyltransferase
MEDNSFIAVLASSSHPEVTALLERYGVKFAYLFGSQASGKSSPQSDVDLAVFFGDGDLKSRTENKLTLVSRIGTVLKKDVDLVVLDDASDNFLLAEIVRHGKIIFDRAPDERFAFEVAKQHEVTDFLTHIRHVPVGTNLPQG